MYDITRTEIAQRTKPIIANVYSVAEDLTELDNEKTEIYNELGLDSLDIVELITELEKEFDIHISDDDFENLETIGDIYDFVFEKIKNK